MKFCCFLLSVSTSFLLCLLLSSPTLVTASDVGWNCTTAYPSKLPLQQVTAGSGGNWCAGGTASTVVYSSDGGDTWMPSVLPDSEVPLQVERINYAFGKFMLFADRIQLASPDCSPGSFVNAQTFEGNIASSDVVAVATDKSTYIYRSTDGAFWEPISPDNGTILGNAFVEVAWGSDVFALLSIPIPGSLGNNAIWTSTDGKAWTKQSLPNEECTGPIAYSPAANQFLLGCPDNVYRLPLPLQSGELQWINTTGLTPSLLFSFSEMSCVEDGAHCVVSVGASSSRLYESNDGGNTWKKSDFAHPDIVQSISSDGISNIILSGTSLGSVSVNDLYLSYNFDVWESISSSIGMVENICGGTLFLASGHPPDTEHHTVLPSQVISSTDGFTWTQYAGTPPLFQIIEGTDVHVGISQFLTENLQSIYYTTNGGKNWTLSDFPTGYTFTRRGGVYAGGGFVIPAANISSNTAVLATSLDGVTWQIVALSAGIATVNDVAYSPVANQWTITTDNGIAITNSPSSPLFDSSTPEGDPLSLLDRFALIQDYPLHCYSLASNGQQTLVAVCNCTSVIYSADGGYTWQGGMLYDQEVTRLTTVRWVNGLQAFAVIDGLSAETNCGGALPMFYVSSDGAEWAAVDYGYAYSVTDVASVGSSISVLSCQGMFTNTTAVKVRPVKSSNVTCPSGGEALPEPGTKPPSPWTIVLVSLMVFIGLLLILIAAALVYYKKHYKKRAPVDEEYHSISGGGSRIIRTSIGETVEVKESPVVSYGTPDPSPATTPLRDSLRSSHDNLRSSHENVPSSQGNLRSSTE